MKEFKHKKTGLIVKQFDVDKNLYCGNGFSLPTSIVEDSNDWEEVIKPDFEIIRYKDSAGNEYYKKHNGKFTINLQYEYDEEKLFNKNLKIQTIKCLSNGVAVMFSVGDKVVWDWTSSENKYYTIDEFIIDGDLLKFYVKEIRGYAYFHDVIKQNFCHYEEEPVYRSFDGYDISEDDEFHAVQKETFVVIESCKYPITDPEKWLIFKNKSKMEEYVWLNKPCLSINDVAKVYVTANRRYLKRPSGWEKQAEQLIEIVKNKLKS
jgi:hypothetical protein